MGSLRIKNICCPPDFFAFVQLILDTAVATEI